MKASYFVYKVENKDIPVVSTGLLPTTQFIYKRKWIGKKAKIEAIRRLHDFIFPDNVVLKEVNNYIDRHIWYTKDKKKFGDILDQLHNEFIQIPVNYELEYLLEVEFDRITDAGSPDIINYLTNYVMFNRTDIYMEQENHIVNISRNFNILS